VYSAAHLAVRHHERLGLFRVCDVGVSEKGGLKKFWVLTGKGRKLLKFFCEEKLDFWRVLGLGLVLGHSKAFMLYVLIGLLALAALGKR
jgi:hypothetical protein